MKLTTEEKIGQGCGCLVIIFGAATSFTIIMLVALALFKFVFG